MLVDKKYDIIVNELKSKMTSMHFDEIQLNGELYVMVIELLTNK